MGLQTVIVETPPEWWSIFDQATGLWTVIAAFIGFLGGTIVNSWLTRRRDDRLKWEDSRIVAATLKGELSAMRKRFWRIAKVEETSKDDYDFGDDAFYYRNLIAWHSRTPDLVYRAVAEKLGLLGADLAERVSAVYAREQYFQDLAHPDTGISDDFKAVRKAGWGGATAKEVVEFVPEIGEAIDQLDRFLNKAAPHWWQSYRP